MYDRYAHAGRSLQVQTKGYYWAGRAALAAGQFERRTSISNGAAAYPELFYGQLALERLGRSVQAPPQAQPQYVTTAAQRAAFNARTAGPGRSAARPAGPFDRAGLFVRALAELFDNDSDR